MLLVGDIHINSKYKDLILTSLRKHLLNSDEENIVFLWDYMYQFVYDKKSLNDLFNFFLELFSLWKKIYILAWNHDWINQTFVFEEVANFVKVIDSFKWFKIFLQPQIEEIEWKKILFLPYNIYLDWEDLFKEFNLDFDKVSIYDSLIKSTHKNERYSWYLNKFLEQLLEKVEVDYIFHHFYFSDEEFVWQKGRFKYKDVAIDGKRFLKSWSRIKFISGHLHQSFWRKNYFCVWSVWATSSLEENQHKFIFKFKNETVKPILLDTNFYLKLEYKNWLKINEKLLKSYFTELLKENLENLRKGDFVVEDININVDKFDIKKWTLIVESQDLSYDDLKLVVESDLFKVLNQIRLKRKPLRHQQIVRLFVESEEKLKESFKSWKELLLEYLRQKYWNDSEKYIDKLRELQIL